MKSQIKMKSQIFMLAIAILMAQSLFAQKGNKFTFPKEEVADDFPMKGKTVTVVGELVALEEGNMIVDYVIYYYAAKREKEGDVVLTKVMLTEPILGNNKKKKNLQSISYFYFSEKTCKEMTISPVADKEGFYQIDAPGNGIPFEEISVDEATKKSYGMDEDSQGFGFIQLGKFKSAADFEKFKKILQQ
jgi:hypothetical protein